MIAKLKDMFFGELDFLDGTCKSSNVGKTMS